MRDNIRRQHIARACAHGTAGKSSRLISQYTLSSDELTIFGRAHLHPDPRTRRRASRLQNLGAAHNHFYRMPGLSRQQRGNRFQIRFDLAAKSPANLQGYNLNLRYGNTQNFCSLIPHAKRALIATPDRHHPIGIPQYRGILRFDITLMHHIRAKLALDNHIGFGKTLLNIAQLRAKMRRHIAEIFAFLAHRTGSLVFMHQGRVILHRLLHIQHMGQHLVFDLNQIQRFFGNMDIDRRHRRHGISLIEHLFVRQHRSTHILNAHHLFAQISQLFLCVKCQILPRNNRTYAFKHLGLARINRLSPSVCMRASQNFGMQHIGQIEVRTVNRPARHLIRAIVPHWPRPHDLIIRNTQIIFLLNCHLSLL